jgi:hypothetical protein
MFSDASVDVDERNRLQVGAAYKLIQSSERRSL